MRQEMYELSEHFLNKQMTEQESHSETRSRLYRQKQYYYPSQRQDSCCCGKGAFKQRFPIQFHQNQKSFCSKMCSILWLVCCQQKVNEPKDEQQLDKKLPIVKPVFSTSQNKITYTWIGHSTAVIAIGKDANLMIDPIFSTRCSPVQFAGPKRYRPPACQVKGLPPIHAAFVSHDHYDHLDTQSLKDLEETHKPIFVAGLDSNDAFPEGSNLIQMDWTEKKDIMINGHKFEVTFVPVCHWSKRKIWEKNTRLWGGFIIQTPKGQKIFYSGDTAYCEIFRQIGKKFGPFDLSILPIGAYLPNWIMFASHTTPEQAVKIHLDLRSKKSVAVHWGTFPLGFEHWHQPKQDLERAIQKHGLKEDEFITMAHGSEFTIDYV